jgi:hypothetical protein
MPEKKTKVWYRRGVFGRGTDLQMLAQINTAGEEGWVLGGVVFKDGHFQFYFHQTVDKEPQWTWPDT